MADQIIFENLEKISLESEIGSILSEINITEDAGITAKGVIELETATPEENSIILETEDPDVFALLQQEDGSKIFTEDDIHATLGAPERLCGVGLHDLILEEEAILQEEAEQIQLEDFTVSLDNLTQEDNIFGQFVPFLGFEVHAVATDFEPAVSIDDNMLFESATHRTENVIIINETGDLIAQEGDGVSHIVLDDFYFILINYNFFSSIIKFRKRLWRWSKRLVFNTPKWSTSA